MKISVVTVAVNLALYYPAVTLLGFAGLASATSTAALLNAGILIALLPRKGVPIDFGRLGLSAFRLAVAAAAAFHVARLLPYGSVIPIDDSLPGRFLGLMLPAAAAGILYLVFCFALRARETTLLKRLLFGKTRAGE
jgi:peptidoglycan biosynthesis protein MviN/MurJ (putative lipid II flippase)